MGKRGRCGCYTYCVVLLHAETRVILHGVHGVCECIHSHVYCSHVTIYLQSNPVEASKENPSSAPGTKLTKKVLYRNCT